MWPVRHCKCPSFRGCMSLPSWHWLYRLAWPHSRALNWISLNPARVPDMSSSKHTASNACAHPKWWQEGRQKVALLIACQFIFPNCWDLRLTLAQPGEKSWSYTLAWEKAAWERWQGGRDPIPRCLRPCPLFSPGHTDQQTLFWPEVLGSD